MEKLDAKQAFDNYAERIIDTIPSISDNDLPLALAPLQYGYIPACMRAGFELPESTERQFPAELQIQTLDDGRTEAAACRDIGDTGYDKTPYMDFGKVLGIDVSEFHPVTATDETGKAHLVDFKE